MEGLGAFFAGILIAEIVIGLGVYILMATAFFKMYKKAGTKHAWLAYVPIAQAWPFFWTIKKSAWNILWVLLPVLGEFFLLILRNHLVVGIIILVILSIVPFVLYII